MSIYRDKVDYALERCGRNACLRRVIAGVNYDATVRAHVRQYKPNELTENIVQGDKLVTLSATEISRLEWPFGIALTDGTDPGIPRRGDFLFVEGWKQTVQAVIPMFIDDELVRISLQVRGG